jgi:hypothetical protein
MRVWLGAGEEVRRKKSSLGEAFVWEAHSREDMAGVEEETIQ